MFTSDQPPGYVYEISKLEPITFATHICRTHGDCGHGLPPACALRNRVLATFIPRRSIHVNGALALALLVAVVVNPLAAVPDSVAAESPVDSLRKYRFLAKTSREQKQYDVAAAHYRKVISFKVDEQKAHFFLGLCLAKGRKMGEAKQAFLQSSRLDSTHVNTNLALTQIYLRAGNADSARHYLEHVPPKKARKRLISLRRDLADSYRRQERFSEAIVHYRILAEAPDFAAPARERAELYRLLADLNRILGRAVEGIAWQRRLLKLKDGPEWRPEDRISSLNDMVELQTAAGAPDVYDTLEELGRLDPDHRYAYAERQVLIATEREDVSRRQEGLEGMARANPDDIPTLAVLAELHLKSAAFSQADSWLQRGLGIDPRDGHLLVLMGDLQVVRGAEEDALASFAKAREDPEWESVAQQRIWQLRPPETEEEKLKREFFGGEAAAGE